MQRLRRAAVEIVHRPYGARGLLALGGGGDRIRDVVVAVGLEGAGEEHGYAPGRDRLGVAPNVTEADSRCLAGRRVRTPERPAGGNAVGEHLAPIRMVYAEGVEFLLLPTRTDAQLQPSTRYGVDGGGPFGEEHGGAQGHYQDSGGQAEPCRRGGDRGQNGQRLVPGGFGREDEVAPGVAIGVRAHDDMVRYGYCRESGRFGPLGDVQQRRRVRSRLRGDRQPQRELHRAHAVGSIRRCWRTSPIMSIIV